MTELALSVLFLSFIAWQNRQWARERADLLLRIQAPQIAVREQIERPRGRKPTPVPLNDDTAYAEAKERRMNGNGD